VDQKSLNVTRHETAIFPKEVYSGEQGDGLEGHVKYEEVFLKILRFR
jgi:hypothetical protein